MNAKSEEARVRRRLPRLKTRVARACFPFIAQFSDIVSIWTGASLAHAVRFGDTPMSSLQIQAAGVATLLALATFPLFGATRIEAFERPWSGLRHALSATAFTALLLIAVGMAFQTVESYSRLWAGSWAVFTVIGIMGARTGLAGFFRYAVDSGYMRERLLVVYSQAHPCVVEAMEKLGQGAAAVVARIPIGPGNDVSELPGQQFEFGSFFTNMATLAPDRAVVLPAPVTSGEAASLSNAIAPLRRVALDVDVFPVGYDPIYFGRRPRLVNDLPVVTVMTRPLSDAQVALKRLEDLVIASILLILLAPLMLILALTVKLGDPSGPVFFRQHRTGFNGQTFRVWKYRSMYAGDPDDVRQAQQNDDRVTRVGQILRRTSLDELPQLFNVLEGSMSLVGPRPHAVAHDQYYGGEINNYIARHRVKPGLTGWAQVNGWRGETETVEKMRRRVEHDLYYVDEWSLLFDIQILIKTAFVVRQKNAY